MASEFISQFEDDKRSWALAAYINASKVLIRAKSINSLISGVCEGVANQKPYVLACVGLFEALPSKVINIIGKAGSAQKYAEGLLLSWDENNILGQGPTGIAIRERKPIVMSDTETASNYGSWVEKARANGIRSSISIPLYNNGTPRGIFIVYASEPHAFGEAEIKLFEILAEELSYGISNLENQEKLLEETSAKEKLQGELLNSFQLAISAIATTLELRDPYTAGHQKRVADIAVVIATEMGLQDEAVQSVKLAALVHDIGKISVPIEYLTKPTKLTPLEFAVIKEHVEKSYEILKDIPFPLPIADIVRQHHERVDGSGYPLGLKGDEILLEAKILTVADVIESMATDRPYRFSPGLEKSIDEIIKNSGILYDACVVDAVKSLHNKNTFQKLAQSK